MQQGQATAVVLAQRETLLVEAQASRCRVFAGRPFAMRSHRETLDPEQFVRISRAHVVRREAIAQMRAAAHGERIVTMTCGAQLTWTRRDRG